jgi:2-C-methyl-D-erythritol 4-phosphate cytidylyltransferase
LPKQYLPLCGKPVLQHALDRLSTSFPLSATYIVVAPDDHWFDDAIVVGEKVRVLRCGGATRAESVRNALDALPPVGQDDWVVVHDAVRPCLDEPSSRRLQQELGDDPVGGFLALPVSDTLKRIDEHDRVVRTESRDALWRAQTPQMFRYHVLRQAFALPGFERRTDEAHAVEALGLQPRAVVGTARNVKITFPEDLALAAAILMAEDHRA